MPLRIFVTVLLLASLASCDSTHSTRDPATGLTTDSVKMEFKDTMTLVLWGVPYSRFSLDFRVHTDASNQKTTDALATCNHIDNIPLTLTIDRIDHTFAGTPQSDKSILYPMTPNDLHALAYAKTIIVRIYHGTDRHEDADIGPDRIRQLKKLYEKNFPTSPTIQ